MGDVLDVVETAIGGENLTTTIEGRNRFPVRVRYARELRDDVDKLGRILVPAMGSAPMESARAWRRFRSRRSRRSASGPGRP